MGCGESHADPTVRHRLQAPIGTPPSESTNIIYETLLLTVKGNFDALMLQGFTPKEKSRSSTFVSSVLM